MYTLCLEGKAKLALDKTSVMYNQKSTLKPIFIFNQEKKCNICKFAGTQYQN